MKTGSPDAAPERVMTEDRLPLLELLVDAAKAAVADVLAGFRRRGFLLICPR